MTPEEYQKGLAALGSPLQLVETNDTPAPEGADLAFVARTTNEAERIMVAYLEKMSPLGALRLRSKLLERRRFEHRITDGHFKCQPLFDHVWVKQLDAEEDYSEVKVATEGGGTVNLWKPETAKTREKQSSFKGVIVAAGQKALDELRSNGVDVGHIVWFVKHVSARFEVETVDGRMEYLLCLAAGDIKGSFDLAEGLRAGDIRIEPVLDENGAPEHRISLRDPETHEFTPTIKRLNPFISEDV